MSCNLNNAFLSLWFSYGNIIEIFGEYLKFNQGLFKVLDEDCYQIWSFKILQSYWKRLEDKIFLTIFIKKIIEILKKKCHKILTLICYWKDNWQPGFYNKAADNPEFKASTLFVIVNYRSSQSQAIEGKPGEGKTYK